MNAAILPLRDEAPPAAVPTPDDAAPATHSLADLFVPAILVMLEKLPETAQLVEKSAVTLSSQFTQLAGSAGAQADQVQKIVDTANTLEIAGETITMQAFTELFAHTLADSVNKILNVSKLAMTMAYQLNDAMQTLSDIESFIGSVQRINKQANLLALNATIESARAGAAGRGFSVVANEVKTVSREINALSESMQEKITSAVGQVRKSYSVLRDVATTDMGDSIAARDKVDRLLESMLEQNARFTTVLQGAANTSRDISDIISGMVMQMQFQDRTSQNIGACVTLLSALQTALEKSAPSAPNAENQAEEIMASLTLSTFRDAYQQHLRTRGIAVHQQGGGASTDDDNVELF